jgi:hypothetical protein
MNVFAFPVALPPAIEFVPFGDVKGGYKSICILFTGLSVLKVIVFDPFNLLVPSAFCLCLLLFYNLCNLSNLWMNLLFAYSLLPTALCGRLFASP